MRSCAMVETTSPTPLSRAFPHSRRFKFSAARFPPWRPIGHICRCATSRSHEELSDHIQGSCEADHAVFEPSQAVPECGGSPRRLTKPRLRPQSSRDRRNGPNPGTGEPGPKALRASYSCEPCGMGLELLSVKNVTSKLIGRVKKCQDPVNSAVLPAAARRVPTAKICY